MKAALIALVPFIALATAGGYDSCPTPLTDYQPTGNCPPRRVNKRDGHFCSDAIQLVTVDCCCPLTTVSTDCPPPGWCPSTVQFTHDDSCDYSSCPSQSPTYDDHGDNDYDHSADDHSGDYTPQGDEDCEEGEGAEHDLNSDYGHDLDSDTYDNDSGEDAENHGHPHWHGKGPYGGDYVDKEADNGDDCEEGGDDHSGDDTSYSKKY